MSSASIALPDIAIIRCGGHSNSVVKRWIDATKHKSWGMYSSYMRPDFDRLGVSPPAYTVLLDWRTGDIMCCWDVQLGKDTVDKAREDLERAVSSRRYIECQVLLSPLMLGSRLNPFIPQVLAAPSVTSAAPEPTDASDSLVLPVPGGSRTVDFPAVPAFKALNAELIWRVTDTDAQVKSLLPGAQREQGRQ
ncbi:uncharacterized protein B0H18DRAFT_1122966 [Fomitopsis serialis]|uniref:uncharacterized protein n=1 Tax=Fomitopsis serialis TaxID=139415 RepID=UPI0020087009|nr:uncharacterized protein B0H18DRAFT_1122966 [Neoantrodia serialis]KAH9918609.1 hypothetical protein B0H18DRAFT_1122966 [Neoantrodia serialis]